MYQHVSEHRWMSLPASLVGLFLVVVLFCILPFTNHVSFTRLKNSGGLSPVPTSPAPSVEIAEAETEGIVLEKDLNARGPAADESHSQDLKIPLEPITLPALDPFVPSERKQVAFVVFDVSDLDGPPVPIHRVAPKYPLALRAAEIEGRVVVVFKVDEDGNVVDAQIEKETRPEFGASVITAVSRWKFLPGTVDGEKVFFQVRLPVAFRVDGTPSAENNVFKLVTDASDSR